MANSSIQSQLLWSKNLLKQNSISPDLDAEVLLSFVLKKNRSYLYTWPEVLLSDSDLFLFRQLITRRSHGEPIAYLTGQREFWSLELSINPNVLIPRPETELLVQTVLDHYPVSSDFLSIADFGTGSGAIAIALAKENPHWKIFAMDQSHQALLIATQNARRHECSNITWVHHSWKENLTPDLFGGILLDAMIANPPYLAKNDPHLSQGDLRFEPSDALISGETGLEDFEFIIQAAQKLLKPTGKLFFEHGREQADSLKQLLLKFNFNYLACLKDLNHHDRVTVAQKKLN